MVAMSHLRIVKKVCGKVPVWPETLRMARTEGHGAIPFVL